MTLSKQLVLVGYICILIVQRINGNEFSCYDSLCVCLVGNCETNCTNGFCQNKEFVCTNGAEYCNITCHDDNSCSNSTFYMASNDFHIDCIGQNSCNSISINCGSVDNAPGSFEITAFQNNMTSCEVYVSELSMYDSDITCSGQSIDNCHISSQGATQGAIFNTEFDCAIDKGLCSLECSYGCYDSSFICDGTSEEQCECSECDQGVTMHYFPTTTTTTATTSASTNTLQTTNTIPPLNISDTPSEDIIYSTSQMTESTINTIKAISETEKLTNAPVTTTPITIDSDSNDDNDINDDKQEEEEEDGGIFSGNSDFDLTDDKISNLEILYYIVMGAGGCLFCCIFLCFIVVCVVRSGIDSENKNTENIRRTIDDNNNGNDIYGGYDHDDNNMGPYDGDRSGIGAGAGAAAGGGAGYTSKQNPKNIKYSVNSNKISISKMSLSKNSRKDTNKSYKSRNKKTHKHNKSKSKSKSNKKNKNKHKYDDRLDISHDDNEIMDDNIDDNDSDDYDNNHLDISQKYKASPSPSEPTRIDVSDNDHDDIIDASGMKYHCNNLRPSNYQKKANNNINNNKRNHLKPKSKPKRGKHKLNPLSPTSSYNSHSSNPNPSEGAFPVRRLMHKHSNKTESESLSASTAPSNKTPQPMQYRQPQPHQQWQQSLGLIPEHEFQKMLENYQRNVNKSQSMSSAQYRTHALQQLQKQQEFLLQQQQLLHESNKNRSASLHRLNQNNRQFPVSRHSVPSLNHHHNNNNDIPPPPPLPHNMIKPSMRSKQTSHPTKQLLPIVRQINNSNNNNNVNSEPPPSMIHDIMDNKQTNDILMDTNRGRKYNKYLGDAETITSAVSGSSSSVSGSSSTSSSSSSSSSSVSGSSSTSSSCSGSTSTSSSSGSTTDDDNSSSSDCSCSDCDNDKNDDHQDAKTVTTVAACKRKVPVQNHQNQNRNQRQRPQNNHNNHNNNNHNNRNPNPNPNPNLNPASKPHDSDSDSDHSDCTRTNCSCQHTNASSSCSSSSSSCNDNHNIHDINNIHSRNSTDTSTMMQDDDNLTDVSTITSNLNQNQNQKVQQQHRVLNHSVKMKLKPLDTGHSYTASSSATPDYLDVNDNKNRTMVIHDKTLHDILSYNSNSTPNSSVSPQDNNNSNRHNKRSYNKTLVIHEDLEMSYDDKNKNRKSNNSNNNKYHNRQHNSNSSDNDNNNHDRFQTLVIHNNQSDLDTSSMGDNMSNSNDMSY